MVKRFFSSTVIVLAVLLFPLISLTVNAQQTQVATAESDGAKKDIAVPVKISGRWVSSQASQSFSLENISVSGNEISAIMTVWAVGDNSCSLRGKQVKGVIQDGIATIHVAAMPCHSDYIAVFNFEKKTGSYTRGGSGGRYEFQ